MKRRLLCEMIQDAICPSEAVGKNFRRLVGRVLLLVWVACCFLLFFLPTYVAWLENHWLSSLSALCIGVFVGLLTVATARWNDWKRYEEKQ